MESLGADLYHTIGDYGDIEVCMGGVIWWIYIRKEPMA
jgi:hypothetical protein